MGQVLIVISAVVSAVAAASVAALTVFLVRATNRYVRLVQEQLDLLRAQLRATLVLDVRFSLVGVDSKFFVTCTHAGSLSSLPAIIKAVTLRTRPLEGREGGDAPDEHSFNDVLQPGRTWSRLVGGSVAAKIAGMPPPGLLRALFHRGPWQQAVGLLSVTLSFERGGQARLEEVTRDYEVKTRLLRGPELVSL